MTSHFWTQRTWSYFTSHTSLKATTALSTWGIRRAGSGPVELSRARQVHPCPPRQSLRLTRKVIKSLKRKWAGETDYLPPVSFLCIPNSRHTALHPFHILAHVTLAMWKAKDNRELLRSYFHSKTFKADTLPYILSCSCKAKNGKMRRTRKLINQ